MTSTLPVHHTLEDGRRFYTRTNPDTGAEEDYWSVTTALSVKEKEGLKRWTAMLAARRAMDNIPMMLKAQRVDPCGRTWARSEPFGCGGCPPCVQKWIQNFHYGESARRALEGSAVHDVLEHWIISGEWWNAATVAQLPAAGKGGTYVELHPKVIEALPPYLEQCQRWVADYEIIPADFWGAEMTVYNHTKRYAGTADWVLNLKARNKRSAELVARVTADPRAEAVDVLGDCKSREGEGTTLYDDHPLQLAAYRRAETCRPSKTASREFPMPPTVGAVVFQPRPDGYAFRPVRAGEDEYKAFLAALELFRWTVEQGATSTQVGTFPVPEGFAWPRPVVEPAPTTDERAPAPVRRPAGPTGACSACGIEKSVTKAGVITSRHTPCPGAGKPPKGAGRDSATPPRIAGATLESLVKPPVGTLAGMPAHPDSPYGDPIPF